MRGRGADGVRGDEGERAAARDALGAVPAARAICSATGTALSVGRPRASSAPARGT